MAYTKQCPDCGERLNASARACACGWSEKGAKAGRNQGPCHVRDCTSRMDGDDGLCGYHRALRNGSLDAYRASGEDWRAKLYAQFDVRHANDTWGALVRASYEVSTTEEKRELLGFLMKMAVTKPLPYNPQEKVAA